jgi:hypothetical protein
LSGCEGAHNFWARFEAYTLKYGTAVSLVSLDLTQKCTNLLIDGYVTALRKNLLREVQNGEQRPFRWQENPYRG